VPRQILGKAFFADCLASWQSTKNQPLPIVKWQALGKGDGDMCCYSDRNFADYLPLPSAWRSAKSVVAKSLSFIRQRKFCRMSDVALGKGTGAQQRMSF
jgi:hypothetical protein